MDEQQIQRQGKSKRSRLKKLGRSVRNVKELIQHGRLGAPYRAAYDVVHAEDHYQLRHYLPEDQSIQPMAQPLLLVPPLMVTSEVYDISPELSAVTFLGRQGVDVWIVDFGAPEDAEHGLERTLDDHILAVEASIRRVRDLTGEDVHVAGYSQGGMFAYQGAAYLQGEGVRSVITFGSPVDIRRNMPVKVHDDLAGRFLTAARDAINGPLQNVEGLPGMLTSRGFKVLNAGKEVKQILGFFGMLHDRDALERREPKRRFLGGEGFISWPGPALRQFIDEIVVNNRLAQGGLVINNKTITMADLHCPILYFVGQRDDLARPASVRAIQKYAPNAQLTECVVDAGHFGLVVGSKAMSVSWPTVVRWIAWHNGVEPEFELPESSSNAQEVSSEDTDSTPMLPLYDLATDVLDGLWTRLGEVSLEFTGLVDSLRWQFPRLAKIKQIEDDTPISVSRALEEQAQAIGDQPFFLWRGKAYSYAQANARVNQIARVLLARGVQPGDHVGVLMDNAPDVLTVITAANRIRAVGVLIQADGVRDLREALTQIDARLVVCDLNHLAMLHEASEVDWLVAAARRHDMDERHCLDRQLAQHSGQTLTEVEPDLGLAAEPALIMMTSGTTSHRRFVMVTNRRWSLAALGSAAACRLTSRDTVYCCLPLSHAMGTLIAVSGALLGGARLALAPSFSISTFWNDVRRMGASVVVYTGQMPRMLASTPQVANENKHPVRLFVGNGMPQDVWATMMARFGPIHILEFYASTEGNVCLVNFNGDKVGSMGRELPGLSNAEVVKVDYETNAIERNEAGFASRCSPTEPGLLIARVDSHHPLFHFEGFLQDEHNQDTLIHDVFNTGDTWFVTGDLVVCDEEGDYWFIDRMADIYRSHDEWIATAQIEEVVYQCEGVTSAVCYGVELEGEPVGMIAMTLQPGALFDGKALARLFVEELPEPAWPELIRIVSALEMTHSMKFNKQTLRKQGADRHDHDDAVYRLDRTQMDFVPFVGD